MAPMMRRAAYPNDWAKLIADLVARDGWNQTKLAKAAGVGRNTVGRWISGQSVDIPVSSIKLLATAAGIEYDIAARAALGAQEMQRADDDAVVRDILADPDAPDFVKQQAIARVRDRRRENEEAIRRDVDLLLRSHRPQTES